VSPFHPQSRRRRATLTTVLIVLTLGTLGSAFYRAQVIRAADFALRAEDNRLRLIPIPAPRGTVYDRNGNIIAETVAKFPDVFMGFGIVDRFESLRAVRGYPGLWGPDDRTPTERGAGF
jgi:hypothetical protein